MFLFDDTKEEKYSCVYEFVSNQDYSCSSTPFEISFGRFGPFLTSELALINDTNSGICTPLFSPGVNEEYQTTLSVKAQCQDGVGLVSQERQLDVEIIYTRDTIVELDFTYENGIAYARVGSGFEYEKWGVCSLWSKF